MAAICFCSVLLWFYVQDIWFFDENQLVLSINFKTNKNNKGRRYKPASL